MPLWLAGQSVTANTLNKMLPLHAFKSSSTSRASTTTIAADPDLAITLSSSQLGTYALEGSINFQGALVGVGDIKTAFSYSGTVTSGVWIGQGSDITAVTAYHGSGRSFDGNAQSFGGNGASFATATFSGMFQPGSAGTLSLLWAQNTSSATATVVRLGSWLRLTRMDL